MVFGLGATELLIILLIIVIIFGASRLGKLGGAVGQGIRDFRDSLRSDDDDGLNPSPVNKRK
ncbi:MAG TPA: twin-arginine translocase TatA/TatE family subunit [Anaerolineae bacterium]|jgi:sec-independent protein translocase protein TatA